VQHSDQDNYYEHRELVPVTLPRLIARVVSA
jgi:hypothetical protein